MKDITIRRNLEQAMHCTKEALSVVTLDEDFSHALADVEQAIVLLQRVRVQLDYQPEPSR